MVNVSQVNGGARREYPNWNTRGRIKKVDEAGNIVEGQYAFAGECVRVSPRFQRGGMNFRVRPERPAVFFAAWAHEVGLLPTPLTPEECDQDWAFELLEPLFETNKGAFYKLESPFAASDLSTQPSLRVGFSFNIPQVLVEGIGTVRGTNGAAGHRTSRPVTNNGQAVAAILEKIQAMRARAGAKPEPAVAPAKKK